MKYGTSFFPYIPPINPFGLKRRFPEAFTYRQRLCIALPCMQFIPLRPYLPNDRYQDFPFFFFAHEYAFIPFFPFHALKPAHAIPHAAEEAAMQNMVP